MAGRRLGDGGDRVRRASRHDLPALRRLLGEASERSERFDRRLLRALVADVYVVDGPGGGLRGALALGFVRSFATGAWRAELDGLWVAPDAAGLVEALLAFAEERAATRQCRELVVLVPAVEAVTALERRGYARVAAWRTAVVPIPPPASPRRRGRTRPS